MQVPGKFKFLIISMFHSYQGVLQRKTERFTGVQPFPRCATAGANVKAARAGAA
ncbi:MAG: hypothetical protein ABIN13_10450 [Mucilaginibacter sp.]